MLTDYELNDAYKKGLRELSPEPADAARDAEELGIAYGEPIRDAHFRAGQEVGQVLSVSEALPPTTDEAPQRASGHDRWVAMQHLSHPASEYPTIPRATAEQQADTSREILSQKRLIRPMGDRP